jgi:hypothetical protein
MLTAVRRWFGIIANRNNDPRPSKSHTPLLGVLVIR